MYIYAVYEITPLKFRIRILLLYQVLITFGILASFLFSFPILRERDDNEGDTG